MGYTSLLPVFLLSVGVLGSVYDDNIPLESLPLIDRITNHARLGKLESLLQLPACSEIKDLLSGPDMYTVFAPSNIAFAKSDVDLQCDVLKKHIVPGAVSGETLKSTQMLPTLLGDMIKVGENAYGWLAVGDAWVNRRDMQSSNGLIHIIDKVLAPESTQTLPSIIEQAVATPSLSTLVSVLTSKGYEPVLAALGGDGPFTVFAPTNDAFAAAGVDPTDVEAVTNVLMLHVVPGFAAYSSDLGPVQAVPSLQGEKLLIRKSGSGVTVQNANVVVADVAASNGVVHVIDSVLLPVPTVNRVVPLPVKQPSIIEQAVATPVLSTLVSVLTSKGYEPVLAALGGEGPFTVFAPTNEAIAAAGVDPTNIAAVTNILKFHVVPGVAAYSSDLQPVQAVPTLQGDQLLVRKSNSGVTVQNANVVVADVAASNGVVHVIDSVMVPTARVDTNRTSSVIQNAIRVGAPLYNSGDIQGCADTYEGAARTLVAAGAFGSDILSKALTDSTFQTADEKAWTLRGAFDKIIDMISETTATSATSATTPVLTSRADTPIYGTYGTTFTASKPAPSVTLSAIEAAIAKGAPLYNMGDKQGCADVYEAAARSLVAQNAVGSETLTKALSEIVGQDAESTAWTLRRAFDSVIASIQSTSSTPLTTSTSAISTLTTSGTNLAQLQWQPVNDVVMGGRSSSTVQARNGIVTFKGYVTTESNGGFATARGTSNTPINLSRCRGIAFEAKGDPVRFSFEIRNGGGWRADQFEVDFTPNGNTVWTRVEVPFSSFVKNNMGRQLPGRVNTARINGFGLKRSAFINGLNKDPSFRNSNFNLQVKGVECLS